MANEKKRRFYFWLVPILLCCTSVQSLAKCPTRMGSIFPSDHFSVISYKGSAHKYPPNTLPAFQDALTVEGANALATDLSMTREGEIILWQDWNPHISFEILTFKEFMEWAVVQDKLKLVVLNLKVPADESPMASIMIEKIRGVMVGMDPLFQILLTTPHKEVLRKVRNEFNEFQFAFDREIPPEGVINYHRFTAVPTAMDFKNSFASIGLPVHSLLPDASTPDPWMIYKFILTLDFKIRDNYKRSTFKYIKIISWTFNDEKKMRCLINLGVDGIVTDKPKLLRQIALDMGKILD
jgi:glycerophosphoryl diester phosphodiesterase